MKRLFVLLMLVSFLKACSPGETEFVNVIQSYIEEHNRMVGGGNTRIGSIEIIESEALDSNKWRVRAIVSGSFSNSSLPNGPMDEEFKDTTNYTIDMSAKPAKVVRISQ